MVAKRIIPCLDCDLQVPQGRVVKGVEFKNIKYAGNPVELAKNIMRKVLMKLFLDITASHERRETMTHVIEAVAENVLFLYV